MAAILRDSTVVVVVVAVVRTRPRAIPLSMNPYMGFFFLYGYGAPLGGPRAAGAPLLTVTNKTVSIFRAVALSREVPHVSITHVSNILSPSNGINRNGVPVNALASDE